MQILTSGDVAQMKHRGVRLPGAIGAFLGPVHTGVQILVWGPQGSGKSTFAAVLARLFAQRFGPSVYVSAEEHLSKTVTDRIKRLGVRHEDLYISTYSGMSALQAALLELGATTVVLDSISKVDPHSGQGVSFLEWARRHKISVILVAHATKAQTYRGDSTIVHEVDVVMRASREEADDDGAAMHVVSWNYPGGKNRLGGDPSADPLRIPMHAAEVPFSDASTDRYLRGGTAVASRSDGTRFNPVEVPFTTTLGEVLGRHKVRSVKRLQALVSDHTMCLPKGRRYVHDGEPGPLALRYTRDSKRGESQIDVIAAGELVDTICASSFRACVKKLADEYGDTELVITDQRHAKLVLGAREYARQERAAETETKRARSERLKKANAVAKKSGSNGRSAKPSASACSAAASELAENGTARAGRVLRPCDEAKTGSVKPKAKRKRKPSSTASAKKSRSAKPSTSKKSMPKKPSSGDAGVMAALESITEKIEAL